MANELNVFAVQSVQIDPVTVQVLRRAGDPARDPDDDAITDVADWLFDGPPGTRRLGASFRRDHVALDDLDTRLRPHLDEALAADLVEGPDGRIPRGCSGLVALLGVAAWRVFDRDEMRRVRSAILRAADDDPDWFTDRTRLGPDWAALATALGRTPEDAYVWAHWA